MTTLTWDRHKGHAWSYDVVDLGYNYRIDEIRAALGKVQLEKLSANNERRRRLTQVYRKTLHELTPQVVIPFENHPGISAAHLMPVLLPAGMGRSYFMDSVKSQGIQTSIHYPPIHTFTAYRGRGRYSLPITNDIASREVTLPLYPTLTDEDVVTVVKAIAQALVYV
jgi:dTDP-4-amino-4,6-dideoxygalactose transaminase